MNDNMNVEDAWEQMEAYMKTIKSPPKEQGAKKKTNATDPINVLNFTGYSNHHSIQESTEFYKVAKITKDIYFTMFPEKEGEIYPSNWIIPVVEQYRRVREHRSKLMKTKEKDAMKGLKMHVVVSVILRCCLMQDNIQIPVPVFLRFVNESFKRSQEKVAKQLIKTELFETYRTDRKKGIKTSLKKTIPQCFEDVAPESLIEFTAFSLLGFTRKEVNECKRLAKVAWNGGKGVFPDSTSPSLVAIGAMYVMCVKKGVHEEYDHTVFGISKAMMKSAYGKMYKLVKGLGSPEEVLEEKKKKKSMKKSSVKVK